MFRRLTAPSPTAQLGQAAPPRQLDPVVEIALTSAGQVLSQSDPGAQETVGLVRRILLAPPAPWSGKLPGVGPKGFSKVSDVNVYLRPVATVAENPLATVLGIVAIPVIAFLLGRSTARPTVAAS